LSKVHFVKDIAHNFVCESIQQMEEFSRVEHDCPYCHNPVRYPLVVRAEDMERMETLIETAVEILDLDYGFTAKILSKVKSRALTALVEKCGITMVDTAGAKQ